MLPVLVLVLELVLVLVLVLILVSVLALALVLVLVFRVNSSGLCRRQTLVVTQCHGHAITRVPGGRERGQGERGCQRERERETFVSDDTV